MNTQFNTSLINRVLERDGADAAIETALTVGAPSWVIEKIRTGEWNSGRKPAAKTAGELARERAAKLCKKAHKRPAKRVGKTARKAANRAKRLAAE